MQNNSLSTTQKLRISFTLAGAIEYIHYKGICHFDIKPQNILLNDFLEPKLADFGLSEMADTD